MLILFQNDDKLGTLQFRQKNLYKFQPDLSAGSESDSLTMLNMVMITAFNKVRSQPGFVSDHENSLDHDDDDWTCFR